MACILDVALKIIGSGLDLSTDILNFSLNFQIFVTGYPASDFLNLAFCFCDAAFNLIRMLMGQTFVVRIRGLCRQLIGWAYALTKWSKNSDAEIQESSSQQRMKQRSISSGKPMTESIEATDHQK